MDIRPIKTDADYRDTLREIETLMTAEPESEAGDRLDSGSSGRLLRAPFYRRLFRSLLPPYSLCLAVGRGNSAVILGDYWDLLKEGGASLGHEPWSLGISVAHPADLCELIGHMFRTLHDLKHIRLTPMGKEVNATGRESPLADPERNLAAGEGRVHAFVNRLLVHIRGLYLVRNGPVVHSHPVCIGNLFFRAPRQGLNPGVPTP